MSSDIEEEDPPTQRPSGQISDDEFWLVSYSEDDDRELTTKEIVAAMKRGEITLSTLVWREGMGEWQPISSIDELRARAGFIVQPFFTDAPPRPEGDSLKAIAALAEDIEELPSSAIQSAPPSSLAEADFLGSDEGDSSLAPPLIDHAAFFKSSPPPDEPSSQKSVALPGLPARGGRTAIAGTPAALSSSKPAQKSEGKKGGMTWVLLGFAVLGAAVAGFLLTPAKDDAAPPQPVAKPAQPMAAAPAAGTELNQGDTALPGTAPASPTAADTAAATGIAPTSQPAAIAAQPANPQPGATVQGTNPAGTTQLAANPVAAGTASPATPAATAEAKPVVASAPSQPRVTGTEPFNKAAAGAALSQAATQASGCRQAGDPSGTAQVEVTFSPTGRATRAIIGGPPFRGTATGSCIAQTMRTASVPPFAGDLVTVQKRVVIQ
jgi:hypothetical protein